MWNSEDLDSAVRLNTTEAERAAGLISIWALGEGLRSRPRNGERPQRTAEMTQNICRFT